MAPAEGVAAAAVCAIHQPNFFPWLGYFDKIRRADVFIFLDRVDYPRSGSGGMGSFSNRVKLMVGGQPRWVGAPLRRGSLGDHMDEIEIDDSQPWRVKLTKTLQANYRKAPRFDDAMALLDPLLDAPQANLATFDIDAIRTIAASLGLSTRFVRQSELRHQGAASELLISLVRAAGCTTYLAGGGAAGYQQDALFAQAGLTLSYQNFSPRPYGEPARYVPGLSVIDYLMHDGRPLSEAFPDG